MEEILNDGLNNLGIYHIKKPLKMNKSGQIISENYAVLYYYFNKLAVYGLGDKLNWSEIFKK